MSAAHAKCRCAHRIHRGQCPHRACGCLTYRPRAAALPPVTPRVVRGFVVLTPKGVAS
jgi:hypothetical protein